MIESKFRSGAIPFYAVCALVGAGLLVYSQTLAFAWDEGFHSVAAQMILAGKKPYLDFLFPQTPLNAYWNAFWMRLFGEGWRAPHAVAAACCTLTAFLTGLFALRRFPVPRWRAAAAMFCAVLVGTNMTVIEFGPITQAYAFCLLAIVGGFWFAILAVDQASVGTAFAAGLASAIAAGGSLLTAPVAPVLLGWMLFANRAGNRSKKLAAFVAGAVLAIVPVLRLLALGPRQTWFCIIQYHLYYRQVDWDGAIRHDLETMAGLIDNTQALLLLLLAAGGILFVWFRSGWERARKQEFYLCALLAIGLAAYISNVHPTFARYYLFTTPFVSYLAAAGIYYAGAALWSADRPALPVAVICVIMTLAAAKELYDNREDMRWRDLENVAAKVRQVVAPDRRLYADEAIFFLLHRLPPSGLESRDSHKLTLSPGQAARLHVIPRAELIRQMQEGKFDAAEYCEDEEWFDEDHLTPLFKHKAEIGDCRVFWDFKGAAR